MRVPFRLHGDKALLGTFRELPRLVQSAVLRRTLQDVIGPFAERVVARAPEFTGFLQFSLMEGGYARLTPRQKRFEREVRSQFGAEVHFGTSDPAGMMKEFGNANMPADPFFRGEWERSKMDILHDIERDLGDQITAGAARVAARNRSKG